MEAVICIRTGNSECECETWSLRLSVWEQGAEENILT
jgi:hypothetical protein